MSVPNNLISQYLMIHFAADKNRNVESKEKVLDENPEVDGRRKVFFLPVKSLFLRVINSELEAGEEDGRKDSQGVEWMPSNWKLRSQLTLC
jgi:hypothetical protein